MASSSPSNGADQPGMATIPSVPSDDSRSHEDVYSSSKDDTAAFLREIAEPDENEEPYDILADNGEFLFEEKDRREYRTINTATPPLPTMDLSAADSLGSDDSEEDSISGRLNSTPKRSNRRRRVFTPTSTSAPRPPSPPILMYQMPNDYAIDSSSFDENDSVSDSIAASSVLTGSIKGLVKDIHGVLDEMKLQSNTTGESAKDDDSVSSDVSIGGTTLLSGELERAQKVFYEFTGIDATGTETRKKLKKKGKVKHEKPLQGSKPSASKSKGSKPSTILFVLFGFSLALIGGLVGLSVFLRKRNSTGIATEASAVISTNSRVSTEATISPITKQDDFIESKFDISKTKAPTMEPTPDPQLPVASSMPSSRPSLRPSEGLKLPVTPDFANVGVTDTPVDTDIGGGDSFPIPDSFIRPWDDDDVVEGEDDFYSNDDNYEYELHPGHRGRILEASPLQIRSYTSSNGDYRQQSETIVRTIRGAI